MQSRPSRPEPSAKTVTIIPAMLLVQPSSGTVRLVTFHGDVIAMPSTIPIDSTTEQRFQQLANEWLRDTAFVSDPIEKFMHPAHMKILGMGEKILPLVLMEVEKMSGHWFMILDAISAENPVTPEDQASPERTAQAWVEWGKKQGLI